MLKKRLLIFFFIGCFSIVSAQKEAVQRIVTPHVSPTLKFTENAGQWENNILFRAQLDGGALFLERDGLTFDFYDKVKYRRLHHGALAKGEYADLAINCHSYKINFEGGNTNPEIIKSQSGTDYENFFLGSDTKKWKSGVKNYHQIWLKEVYNGIDYEVITTTQGIKYNFHVKKNANAEKIKMTYSGVDKLKLKDGNLILKLEVNTIVEQKPYAYQVINGSIKQVACHYKLVGNSLSFYFPNGYDKNYDLIIDPILVFAAQSGSTADNFGMTATYDAQGNLYAGGTAFNTGYPVTLGAYSSVFAGLTDVVITKYNATGNSLLYSTYIGGTQAEIVSSLIVDGNNNLCFYGATGSNNFPITAGAYDNSFNGGQYLSFIYNGTTFNNGTDIYVGKFNATGTSLLASTYIGGSDNDGVNHVNHLSLLVPPSTYEYVTDSLQQNYGDQYRGEIQLDILNNIYIASSTRSSNFPMANAFDNTLGGKQDAIIAKFNPSLTQLMYSTYLGGTENECGNSLIVNSNFEVYLTGGTCSSNFPIIAGANSATYNGGIADGFIAHLSSGGNSLLHSTYVGTSSYDQSYFIQSDKYNDIYVYGQSLGNMPIVNSGTIVPYNNPGRHQFITRYNSTLSAKNMSTVFGSSLNSLDISPSAFAVDKCNNIYLSGWGGNIITGPAMSGMPLFQATQNTTNGFDFYFMGLDSNAAGLKYGSYFGGNISAEHVDGGTSRFDPGGKIYQSVCAGCGGNSAQNVHQDFPVTPGAWPGTAGTPNHNTDNYNCNNGVVKLDFQLQLAVATINTNTLAGCAPINITFTNAVPPTSVSSTYTWNLGNGYITSSVLNPSATYTAPGVYTISLIVTDNLTCNKTDKSITYVTVYPKPNASFLVSSSPCSNTIAITNTSSGNLGPNPNSWNFGNGTTLNTQNAPIYTYPNNGSFLISHTVTDVNGCQDIVTNTVSVFNFTPGVVSNSSLCIGSTTTITASGGTSYTWSPANTLNNPSIATPIANPTITTVYTVQILNNSQGYNCSNTLIAQVQVFPKPTANFSLSFTPCSNTISTSNSSSGNFPANPNSWNFGDGSSPSNFNSPTYTYPSNGNYTVTLTVTDVNGCTDVKTNTVSILNFTTGIVSSPTICIGATTTITASGGTSYTWSPPNSLSNNFISNPAANPSVTTIYTLMINNNSFGNSCSRTLTTQLIVNPVPTSDFEYTANPCGGDVAFHDLSFSNITSWNWTLGSAITSTIQSPSNFYTIGGSYTVSLVTTNNFGCKNKIIKTIEVITPPALSISNQTNICIGSSVQLEAEGGLSYHWYPDNQTLDSPTSPNPIATPVQNTQYSVVVTTSNTANGSPCQFSLTTNVEVFQLSTVPISALADPAFIMLGNSSTLVYLGSPGATVTWYPANSTSPATGYTVTANPGKATTYTAVASKGSCSEPTKVFVDVYSDVCLDKDFFIPNTFTPNGDGKNDEFRVRGLKVDEFYFAIYNRWGELIFETTNLNTGWDGKYKGKAVDVGVFGWYLKVKCFNGQETFKKGNVTLIR